MGTAFGVLGPLEVRDAAGSPIALGGQKPRRLLAALLLHRGQLLFVDRLVDFLWGRGAPQGAATTLRTYVGQVRRVLAVAGAAATLESRAGGYVLDVDAADVDADRFELLLRRGQEASHRGDHEAADAVLEEALGLWRGDVVADLSGADFAVAAAARLHELRIVAWEGWLDAQLTLGRHRAVVTRLQALVDEHPFRERFSAQLMLALYRSGRQADALAVSAATRLRLAEELGVDPGPELRELETSMLRQSPQLDANPVTVGPSVSGHAPSAVNPPPADRGAAAYADLELLEREGARATLARVISAAASGRGGGVGIAGDAGTGKSTLVQVACADGPLLRVLRGQCDPLSTPRPLGPFRDIAREAGLTALDRGSEISLPELCEQVYAALRSEPTVLVVEDVHWIDAASVDVLRFLARRVGAVPVALLVTYRDTQVSLSHPARLLLGDLATLRGHETVHLEPLSGEAVRRLLRDSALDPVQVHQVTGGNPFFVTEVIKDPSRPLPATVRDAVLARTADIAPEDFEVLQLVATAPDRLDDRVLALLGLDTAALHRLDVTGLLSRCGGGLVYRHELARKAIESTIPVGGGTRLNRLLLDALERLDGQEPAVLTHHAVAAGDHQRAVRYARAAAEESIRAGAHTEAVAFLEIARRHLRDGTPAELADLLQRLSVEQYMTSRLEPALDNLRATISLWEQVQNRPGLSAAHESSALLEYYNARRREAEAHADHAAAIARDAGAVLELGSARATRAFLAYLRSDLDLALTCAHEAAQAAAAADHSFLAVRAEVTETSARLVRGSVEARDVMTDHIEVARARGWDELASTCYSQLASIDVEHHRLRPAEQVLEEALPFSTQRDIPICTHWQRSLRTRVLFAQGRWSSALDGAEEVLGRGSMPLAKLWPSLVVALVPLRRGDARPVGPALERAWRLVTSIDEPVRRLAVLAGLAEAMWTTGVEDHRVTGEAVRDVQRLAEVPGAG